MYKIPYFDFSTLIATVSTGAERMEDKYYIVENVWIASTYLQTTLCLKIAILKWILSEAKATFLNNPHIDL